MEVVSPTNPQFAILDEPELCGECKTASRLANGLCLNCLLRGALDDDGVASETGSFKEALAGIKSRDGDWHIGEHEILDEIARGGMGVIYRAREPHSGRIVALKCMLAYQTDSDQALARFRREAETIARLDHPNIIPIFHVGETQDGSPFFTMKYAPNGNLAQRRDSLRQEPRQSVLLMAKVARALQYAHEQGVLHRDLKPGNILLDGRGEPLVSDFGLACCNEVASHLTRSLTTFGTPGYVSPEQADGPAARLTPAADIYSLGAILFELFTGRPPFVGDNALNVMKQAAEKSAPKLRMLAPHLDRDLETICERCLERDPLARYGSAGDLAQDLINWLEGRPIVARPIGLWFRSWRWARSNRKLAALVVAFLVLVPVAIGWRVHANKLQTAVQESVLASRSVVVLPFFDLDKVAADPKLARSLADSLQAELNLFGPARIKTIGPEFSFDQAWSKDSYKTGQQTGARTVLTGTVRAVQGRKRISLRFLDVATGDSLLTSLWEENGEKNPVEAATKEVGGKIYPILSSNDWSNIIQAKVDPGLRNKTASEAMTAGRLVSHSTVADIDNAIGLFKKAIEAEPTSALAHAYLAMHAAGRTHYSPDLRFLELGKAEAEKALLLAPNLGEAHKAKASVSFQEGKFSEALEEQMRVAEAAGLDDRLVSFIGQTSHTLGRIDQALSWYTLLSQKAGTPGEVDSLVGDCWANLADDEQALRAYNRALEYRPDFADGILGIAHVRLLQGDFDGARKTLRSGRLNRVDPNYINQLAAQIEFFARDFHVAEQLYQDLIGRNGDGGGSAYGLVTYTSALGRAKQALGEVEEAKAMLELCRKKEQDLLDRAPQNAESAYRLAAVEASLGNTDAALVHLRMATASGWVEHRSLNLDPRFDSIRGNSSFQMIINDLSVKTTDMRSRARKQQLIEKGITE